MFANLSQFKEGSASARRAMARWTGSTARSESAFALRASRSSKKAEAYATRMEDVRRVAALVRRAAFGAASALRMSPNRGTRAHRAASRAQAESGSWTTDGTGGLKIGGR